MVRVDVVAVGEFFNVLEWKDKSGAIYGLCEGVRCGVCFETKDEALRAFENAERNVRKNITKAA